MISVYFEFRGYSLLQRFYVPDFTITKCCLNNITQVIDIIAKHQY